MRREGTNGESRAGAVAGVAIALFLSYTGCADAPDGRDRLLASAAAIQRLSSVAYEYTYEGMGSAAGSYTGTVRLARPADGPPLYRAELRPSPTWDPSSPTLAAADLPPALLLFGGGDPVAARDEALARFSHGTVSGGSGHLVAYSPFAVLTEFVEAAPFEVEVAADFELVSQETIGEVLCDVLRGTTDEFGRARVWWHISVEDDLPRAFRWEAEDGSGTLAFEIRQLIADPVMSPTELGISLDITDPATGEVIEEDERRIEPGVPAPDWTLDAEGGSPVRLSDLRGEVVVLSFWSSWCAPCRELAASYASLSQGWEGESVRFLALNGWESPEVDPGRTMRDWGLEAPVLLRAEHIASDYKLASPPALYVVDARGNLALVRNPALDAEAQARELEQAVESLLASAAEGGPTR